jgi:hypothetical protein
MADNRLIRSPRQASTVYGLDGNTVPRKKSLFYVRFRRSSNGQNSSEWQQNLGFIVKSIDRPSVQPNIEELNQYNKRRQVTTGFKLQAIRMSLYDTADSLVMRMWDEYTRWYFGDFNQEDDRYFKYDVTSDEMLNNNGAGFGYVPRSGLADELDLNSQFFFDAIEVYQVFGGYFTQFDLIHPKISTFDPDDFDFENTTPSTIQMTLNYEAINYRNSGAPLPISSNEQISAAFNQQFDGNTIDTGDIPSNKLTRFSQPASPPNSSSIFADLSGSTNIGSIMRKTSSTVGSGVLGVFGNYDFGALATGVANNLAGSNDPKTRSLAVDVAYLAKGSRTLATALNVGKTLNPAGISGVNVAAGSAALTAAGSTKNNAYANKYVNSQLLSGVISSAIIGGKDSKSQILSQASSLASSSGLALNSQSIGIINSLRPVISQIGFNKG